MGVNLILTMMYTVIKNDFVCKHIYKQQRVNGNDHFILLELYRRGGECNQDDLIKVTCLSKSTISRELIKLAEDKKIELYTDPDNKLKNRVRLLDKGVEYAKESFEALSRWSDWMVENLSKEEYDNLYEWMMTFYENIKTHDISMIESAIDWPMIPHLIANSAKAVMNRAAVRESINCFERNQRIIMLSLYYGGVDCNFKYIEKRVMLAQSCVVKQISKLEDAGMVEAFTDNIDKRVKRAKLTDEGRIFTEKIITAIMEDLDIGCKNIPKKDLKEFERLIDKVCKNSIFGITEC